jgi:hypothetical protein
MKTLEVKRLMRLTRGMLVTPKRDERCARSRGEDAVCLRLRVDASDTRLNLHSHSRH